jgi:hypothetical protein
MNYQVEKTRSKKMNKEEKADLRTDHKKKQETSAILKYFYTMSEGAAGREQLLQSARGLDSLDGLSLVVVVERGTERQPPRDGVDGLKV